MKRLANKKGDSVPLLVQFIGIIIQGEIYLLISWLDAYFNTSRPISSLDKFFWLVIVPITWFIYALISYKYSHKLLQAIFQGLFQTIFSYAIVIASILFFYTWIEGSF